MCIQRCGLEVHGNCYGNDEDDHSDVLEGSAVSWFCESCKAGVPKPVCVMCPIEGGAFKQLDESGQCKRASTIIITTAPVETIERA